MQSDHNCRLVPGAPAYLHHTISRIWCMHFACQSHRLASTSFRAARCISVASRSSSGSSKNMAGQQGRGAFILFEGVDRSGKSTQARKLVEALQQQGVPAQLWNFPDRVNTCTGSVINEYLAGSKDLNDQAVHLLFSANRHEKRTALVSALLSGTTLVVDRYAFSGVAYSAAKGVPGMDVEWCRNPDIGLPAPDLVVYLRVSNAVAAARAGFGEERYEKAEFQDKVRAVFEQLREPEWLVQDASQPIEQIHQQVLQEAVAVVQRCQQGEPVKQLWDRTPFVQAQQQHQAQQRTAGKPTEVTARPVKQQEVQQQRDEDVRGVQDVGGQ